MADSEDEFRDTVALLARSQVAVYPIDARGLMSSPTFDASSSRNYAGRTGAARMRQDETKFFVDTAQEHSTMRDMAEATGGRAFLDTNGLTKAVATAIDEGSNFYTLTYTPTNSERDGRLRKIRVQVTHPGVTLAYRKGYYADDPNSGKRAARFDVADSAVKGAGVTPQDAMHMAMTRGAPTPTEILIKVAVYPDGTSSQTEEKVAEGNVASAKLKGPFRRYSVNYAINPSDISFRRGSDGKVVADFDLVVFVFDPDGTALNSLGETIHLNGTVEQIRKVAASGLQYNLQISAPAKGESFLRIAVHDLHRDHFGAVEVAVSSVRNLTAPQPAATVPAK